jgi:hypothetical protein
LYRIGGRHKRGREYEDNIKLDREQKELGCDLDSCGLKAVAVADCCEHANKILGLVNDRKFFY